MSEEERFLRKGVFALASVSGGRGGLCATAGPDSDVPADTATGLPA